MRTIRMGLWHLVYWIGFAFLFVAVLLAYIASRLHPGAETSSKQPARARRGLDELLSRIQNTETDTPFIRAELEDGPGDGRYFPLDPLNAPPRLPYRTAKELHWYIPVQRPDGRWVWKHQPTETVVS